jgi:hydroxyethylthiazole kinase-like uncharacterized protein yjeF
MNGRPILTTAETRAAEAVAIEAGTSVEMLMERAGSGAAEAICRYVGGLPTLVICGPGNNGGDGYVIARILRGCGIEVRVAALAEPQSVAAQWARSTWDGEVEALAEARDAPVLVDALFGTGLARPLDEQAAGALNRLAQQAKVRIAVDLPSGVATDDGKLLSPVPDYELTITFGTLKPSHLLQPAASHLGRLVVADIGLAGTSNLHEIGRPRLPEPGGRDHKYSRGYVAIVAGQMPGAAALTASAALRAGAGYVRLIGEEVSHGVANAVVQGGNPDALLQDERIDALVVGPGLGRDREAERLLHAALAAGHPLVLDADALVILGTHVDRLRAFDPWPILTPHAGEFARLFGEPNGSKIEAARVAARDADSVIVLKGADTVVAAPDGRAAIAPPAPAWLATAGTGDVLTGVIATMRAKKHFDPFEAACAGVWMHRQAAVLAGSGLIADDLVDQLPAVIAAAT